MNLARPFAVFLSTIAVSMACAGAIERAGTIPEKIILGALAGALCLSAHLIPSLGKKRFAWVLFAACFMATAVNHTSFFVNAGIHAGEIRASTTVQARTIEAQLAAKRQELQNITARPLAIVASERAQVQDWKIRHSLDMEINESRHMEALNADVSRLTGELATSETAATTEPVAARIASLLSSNAESVGLVMSIMFAIILDLTGAWAWSLALHQAPVRPIKNDVPIEPIDRLRAAVEAGQCKGTVSGIREFMQVSQGRAMMYRKQLLSTN